MPLAGSFGDIFDEGYDITATAHWPYHFFQGSSKQFNSFFANVDRHVVAPDLISHPVKPRQPSSFAEVHGAQAMLVGPRSSRRADWEFLGVAKNAKTRDAISLADTTNQTRRRNKATAFADKTEDDSKDASSDKDKAGADKADDKATQDRADDKTQDQTTSGEETKAEDKSAEKIVDSKAKAGGDEKDANADAKADSSDSKAASKTDDEHAQSDDKAADKTEPAKTEDSKTEDSKAEEHEKEDLDKDFQKADVEASGNKGDKADAAADENEDANKVPASAPPPIEKAKESQK